MKKACLFLLAGLYAPQLSSFASHSDLILLLMFAIVASLVFGRLSAVLIVAAGYILFVLAAYSVIDTRIAADFVGDSIMANVRITSFPQAGGQTVSFIGEVESNAWVPSRIRVAWFEPPQQVSVGDIWRLELRSRRPRGNSNPDVFDYETWLFRKRIAATAYVVDSNRNRLLRSGDLGALDHVRLRVVERLGNTGLDAEKASVLAAISVGARHLMSKEQWDRYARSGTSHLMAISGLHVGMVAAAGYLIMAAIAGLLRLRVNQHALSTITALAFACAYAGVSGLAVPAQRSAAMIGLSALAILGYRTLSPFGVVATTCLALSILSPLATMDPGFKLSFAAVLILIWMARRLMPRPGIAGRPLQALRLLMTVQIALLFGLLPMTVLLFGRVSMAAPVINLVAVPVFSVATVPLTLCGLLLDGPLQQIGDQALHLASLSLGLVEWLIDFSLRAPFASMRVASMSGWSLAILFVPLVWVILPRGWPGRSIAWVMLLAVLLHEPSRPAPGCAWIDVLDVGQGLAVVVSTRSNTTLYDTGPAYRASGSAAESVVLPYLSSRRVDKVDDLIVSHADLDHAGGSAVITDALPVARIHAGEDIGGSADARRCVAGTRWNADGIGFEFLYPAAGAVVEGNNASCVLQVSAGKNRVLLSGDIESAAETELLHSGRLERAVAVIVPHHGSRTSSGPALVSLLNPKFAIISAGFGNRWGLPDEEVVARWEAAGAEVLNTATDGAISLETCEHHSIKSLTRQRSHQRRIWHE